MKGSSLLILVGLAMTLVAFLVVWGGSSTTVTKTTDHSSKMLEISPESYSHQAIPYMPGWDTHFSFTVEGTDIKYMLLELADRTTWEQEGQLPDGWTEASSDFSHWEDGIPAFRVGGDQYLFYNDDPQPKTVLFEYFLSEDVVSIDYFSINGGFSLLILGAGILISGLCRRLPASMNPHRTYMIAGSSYLSVLLIAYLLPLFYPFLTPYCWFLIPAAANFLVAYIAGDLYAAIKVVIAFLLIHITMIVGLLGVPLFYDALTAYALGFTTKDDPFAPTVVVILTYSLVNIILGVTMSCLGIIVRNHSRRLRKLLLRGLERLLLPNEG